MTRTGAVTALDYTAVLILACFFIPLERLIPLHDQPLLRRNWKNDVFYLLFNGFVIRSAFTVVAGSIMYAYSSFVDDQATAWVRALPLWVQVIAIVIIADIGYYTAHRLSHAIPFLWRFHAVHHSIEEMDWLATHRVHPVDQLMTKTLSLMPIFMLGFSAPAVAIHFAVYQAHALFLHSNVRLRIGPLKWLIASPEYHHWHHANQREAYDRNFASQLAIIDVVAGTVFIPKTAPEKYGLTVPMPDLYHQQFLHPFRSLLRPRPRPRPRYYDEKGSSHEQDA